MMSKLETPMIYWYWEQTGGTLIEEFQAVKRTASTGQRLIDAVILPNGPKKKAHWRDVSVNGEDVICIQAKRGRLGMYLMGQTLFSAKLLKRMGAKSVKSIALCEKDDSVLNPLLNDYDGMEVVLYPGD
jgi:hypothetical protein